MGVPLISGVVAVALLVPDVVGSERAEVSRVLLADWMEIWAFHPHMQPYSFSATRLVLVWQTGTAPSQSRDAHENDTRSTVVLGP